MKNTKTYSAKPSEVSRQWLLFDASETSLGRLASVVAQHLTGKNKAMYTPNIDCGDYAIVINAEKLVVTGNKLDDKIYYRHSLYPGGIKDSTLKARLENGESTKVIEDAVRGMIPKNKLQNGRMARLKVYAGPDHDNQAQGPKKMEVK